MMNSWKIQIPLIRDGYTEELLKKTSVLRKKKRIYPAQNKILHALEILPFDQVRVVILGQDPYHGEGQAHGLAFSVPNGIAPPPSLKNILKEMAEDMGKTPEQMLTTNLSPWARQGVLLLNTILTVEEGRPLSHKHLGWTVLTDQIIEELARQKDHLVFLLWGAQAQTKIPLISKNHLILSAAHPSPLSAYRGFFGCRHFSRTNNYLQSNGLDPIDW